MPQSHSLTVKLFAKLREVAGSETVTVELSSPATVADVRNVLAERFPELAGLLARSAVAVNHDFAADSVVVEPGSEVAIIPPVSGG